MCRVFISLFKNDDGATAIEYALIAVLISIAAVAIIPLHLGGYGAVFHAAQQALRTRPCADNRHHLAQPASAAPEPHLALQRDAARHQQHDTAREPQGGPCSIRDGEGLDQEGGEEAKEQTENHVQALRSREGDASCLLATRRIDREPGK